MESLKHLDYEVLKSLVTERVVGFKVFCGDWIYPSKDSTSGVAYSVDVPVVAEIFPTCAITNVASKGGIDYHLNSPRFIEIDLLRVASIDVEAFNTYHFNIRCIKNKYEPLFEKELNITIPLGTFDDIEKLDRYTYLANNKYCGDNDVHLHSLLSKQGYGPSIFFTSALLKFATSSGLFKDNTVWSIFSPNVPELDIKIRKASIPEIESLGKWA